MTRAERDAARASLAFDTARPLYPSKPPSNRSLSHAPTHHPDRPSSPPPVQP